MAIFPTILVNNTGGSDSAASGAGPGTALTGSLCAINTNTTVNITDAVDLSGVALDGSAALYVIDSTAGDRRFSQITNITGGSGAWVVTVATAYSRTTTGLTWAIGGKRASVGSATSSLLIENNGASGDAMPGWTMEMQSGHTETIAATINPRRAGDATNGPITLQGTSGAGTMPVVTFSNNGDAWSVRAVAWTFRDFEMRNSNGTKNASNAFNVNGFAHCQIRNLRINNAASNFWRGIVGGYTNGVIRDCDIRNTASHAIDVNSTTIAAEITNNMILSAGGGGIVWVANADCTGLRITGNVIAFCVGSGIDTTNMTSAAIVAAMLIRGNAIHGNGGDGLLITATSAQQGIFDRLTIENNRLTFNGGYGINFSGSGITDAVLNFYLNQWRNNNFYLNTSGKYFPTTLTVSQGETTTDPSAGASSATKDYTGSIKGTNFMALLDRATGYPVGGTLAVGTTSATYSYVDIGPQHKDDGGLVKLAQPVKATDSATGTAITAAFTGATTAGNHLVIAVFVAVTTSDPTVAGFTAVPGGSAKTSTGWGCYLFYKPNAGSVSSAAVTVASGRAAAVTMEFSGLPTTGTLDQASSAVTAGTTPASSGSVTTTTPQQVAVVGFAADDSSSGTDFVVPANTAFNWPVNAAGGTTLSYAVGIRVFDSIQVGLAASLSTTGAPNVAAAVATFSAQAIGAGGGTTGAPFSRIFTGQ